MSFHFPIFSATFFTLLVICLANLNFTEALRAKGTTSNGDVKNGRVLMSSDEELEISNYVKPLEGTELEEFEGYIVHLVSEEGTFQRFQFPNGITKDIVNLPEGIALGSEKVVVRGSRPTDPSIIDAGGFMPDVVEESTTEDSNAPGPTVTRTALVVRVIDSVGAQPTATAAQLGDDWFGSTTPTTRSVKKQFEDCSDGQFILNPVPDIGTGTTIGTVETTISIGTSFTEISSIENAVTLQLNADFGVTSPNDLADHVIYCIPFGTVSGGSQGWVAYAYLNPGGPNLRDGVPLQWLSVYNNDWCQDLTTGMHEVRTHIFCSGF